MKVLKFILYVLLALVVIIGILTFVAPTHVEVQRSIVINAPKEVVFKNVKLFSARHKWSPWIDPDPNLKWTVEGTDGEVGAIYKWEGNEEVGKGSQELLRVEDLKRVEDKVKFIEPMEGEADGFIQLDDTAGMVKVTWGFSSESPRPFNVMHLFMSMDKMIGGPFETGLGRLKKLSEEEAKGAPQQAVATYNVQEVQWAGKTYLGKKETVGWNDISTFYQTTLPEIFKAMGENKVAMDGPPSGLFFSWDEANQKTEMAATIPVKDLKKDIKGFEKLEVKAGKALQVAYYGSYEKSIDAHNAITAYIKEKNLKHVFPVIEEYVTDPMNEKDTTKWLTNIYYLVE